jgi:hypothetical protein
MGGHCDLSGMTGCAGIAIDGVWMKFYFWCCLALVVASPCFGQDPAPVQITSNSWTVIADSAHSTIQISFQPLDALVRNVRVGFQTDSQRKIADGWTAERVAPDQLNIRTSNPESGWTIVALSDALRISCTHGNAVVTGDVPISTKRFTARLLDPEGTPVSWVGTKEVKETYGAAEVRNLSSLPRENPEVMYFALGQIASPLFHSLFDQQTDTAIDFPPSTVLTKTNASDGTFRLSMPVPGNAIIRIKADYYTKTLRLPFYVPFDDSYFKSAPMVWSSWTSYYEDVTEKDMVSNTDWIATNLKPYGFQYVELDDGYDRNANGQHSWIEGWNRAKFPNGPEWLAAHIKDKGLQAGIWLVPNAYAGAIDTHPDWYLHYSTGKVVLDYNTPALDATNPEVLNFVQKLFTTLDDWGFTYYKFDGEHALPKIVPNIDQGKIHDRFINPTLAYRNRLQRIRNTIGAKRFIEVCPAGSPLDGIGYVNSYFNGHDLYDSWHGMYSLFGSINGNAFLNHVVVYVMPGEGMSVGPHISAEEAQEKRSPVVLNTEKQREFPLTGFGVSDAEARTVLTHVALTGVAYALASVMPELSPDRVKMLQMTLPTRPIVPIDLFSRGSDVEWDTFKHVQSKYYIHNFPEILDLKVNGSLDDYDVVAFTNWRDQALSERVSLYRKLGLNADDAFVAFDFWNQEFVGIFNSYLDLSVDPHDTRVLLLRQMLGRPQIIGSSRHITGDFSFSGVSWDDVGDSLQGTSEIVPGDPYSFWLFIPAGFQFVEASEDKDRNDSASIQTSLHGSVLKLTLSSARPIVHWNIEFAKTPMN